VATAATAMVVAAARTVRDFLMAVTSYQLHFSKCFTGLHYQGTN